MKDRDYSASSPSRTTISRFNSISHRNANFYDRLRKYEIDRQNKVLLSNMLAIEKDLGDIKKKFDNNSERGDIGSKPTTVTQTLQKSMI